METAPKRRGRPPKVRTPESTTPTATEATVASTCAKLASGAPVTLFVIRDRLSGQFVDCQEFPRLNNIDQARFWQTREEADAFRKLGSKPDAEETVEIEVSFK